MKTHHIIDKTYLPPRALVQKVTLALLIASVAGGAACSSTMNTPSHNGGSGGAKSGGGGHTGSPGLGGSPVGPPPGIGGFTGGSTGAGGGPVVVQKLCATKITVMNPTLINFESYDGMVTADKFGTAFGGTAANMGTAYTGPYAYGDGSVTPTLSILAGHPPSSTWAVGETAMQARTWGMGGGFWMSNCANASAYKGISFWVRGSAPLNVFSFSLSMDSTTPPDPANAAGGGTCTSATCTPPTKADIPLTADWTQVQIPWSDFAPGMNGATAVIPNGDNIVGLGWSVPLMFMLDPSAGGDAAGPYVAVMGDLLINIDDVAFIQ